MKFTFDYNTNRIWKKDGSREEEYYSPAFGKRFGSHWPLLVFNVLLKDYYGQHLQNKEVKEYVAVDALLEKGFNGYKSPNDLADIVSRSVGYINDIILDGTELAIISHITDKGLYIIEPKSTNLSLEWEAKGEDSYTLGKYGVDLKKWSCAEPIEFKKSIESPSKIVNRFLKEEVASDRHKAESVKSAVLWNGEIIKTVANNLSGNYINIEEKLMPSVNIHGKSKGSLSSFILDEYINKTQYPNKKTVAILEGDEGAGKSYSLYFAAKQLCDAKHIAIVASLDDIFSEEGTNSILAYICQYMDGNKTLAPAQRVKNLCKKATDAQKVFIIIDSLDEVFPGYYKQIGSEISTILDIGNPNVYVLLAGRNASDFIENSGIQDTDFINMYCENLALDVLREDESDLAWIMQNYPNTATPLFVSYFRETKALYDVIRKNSSRTKNLNLYGDAINFRSINNYYDLYTARTSMLCAHAKKDTGSDALFSSILPNLAYIMYEAKTRKFNSEVVQSIDHYLFEDSSVEERIGALISTGIVRRSVADKQYVFAHYDYMQFLAAKHASEIVSYGNEESRSAVLSEAVERSSYYGETDKNNTMRLDKMRFIPYCYYLCMNIVHANEEVHDNSGKSGERSRKKTFDYKVFDSLFFRLGANVVYEGRDLWAELKDLIDDYLKDQNSHIISNKKRKIKCDQWELEDAINVISYTMTTRKVSDPEEKWNMLHRIQSNLCDCAGIVLNDIYTQLGRQGDYNTFLTNSGRRWNDVFCKTVMSDLIESIRLATDMDCAKWKYPVDLIGRLYGNLGAVLLEKARYSRSHISEIPGVAIPSQLLEDAEEYHTLAKDYREAIVEIKPELRSEISLIRSNIALGSDQFYRGLFENNAESAIKSFKKAVEYYETALKLQGLDINQAKNYTLDTELPVPRTISVEEEPRIGAEPVIIWPRIAGCYYMCYLNAKKADDNSINNKVEEYIENQYVALKSSYLFIMEDCIDNDGNEKLNQTKLEINTAEIEKLWTDVNDKFIKSFSDLHCDNKTEKHDLLKKILQLYKELHRYSDVGVIKLNSTGEFELSSGDEGRK